MTTIKLLCRNAHPFLPGSGALDEEAWRWHVNYLLDSKIHVGPGSGGIGEAYTMSIAELRRVYEISVEESKGKLPVYANPGERHTAEETLQHIQLAVDAGCQYVNLYALQGLHGMHPTDAELMAYYDWVIPRIRCPVILSVNRAVGYTQSAKLIAQVIRKYPQVEGVYLTNVNESYLVNLQDMVGRDIDYIFQIFGSFNAFVMGARGLTVTAANLIPKTHRQFIDCFENRQFDKLAPLNAGLLRFNELVRSRDWTVRWVKMAWRVLKLPGGEGGLHAPHQMPDEAELQKFSDAMLAVGLPEINDLFKAAGLR